MSRRDYQPGPAAGAKILKDGDLWTLVLVRELGHSPEKVWQALTDPEQLKEWAPFETDRNLGTKGTSARLTTVGAPQPMVSETSVKRAEACRVLEYDWGGRDVRWELEAIPTGTRLTLWAGIDRPYIAMGAAGWHLCLDVLAHLLGGDPLGRIVGADALGFDGWQRLYREYTQQFETQSKGDQG